MTLWDWRDLGTPKLAGGLDDQPAGFLYRARYIEAAYNIMRRFYSRGAAGFNENERRIFKRVLELRKQHASNR